MKSKECTRKRSVDRVLEEIEQVGAKHPLKCVHFLGDIFNLRNDGLEESCEKYPREIGLPFDVILMANMSTEEHIRLLSKAGCVYARRLRGRQRLRRRRRLPQEHDAPAAHRRRRMDHEVRHPPRLTPHARRAGWNDR